MLEDIILIDDNQTLETTVFSMLTRTISTKARQSILFIVVVHRGETKKIVRRMFLFRL